MSSPDDPYAQHDADPEAVTRAVPRVDGDPYASPQQQPSDASSGSYEQPTQAQQYGFYDPSGRQPGSADQWGAPVYGTPPPEQYGYQGQQGNGYTPYPYGQQNPYGQPQYPYAAGPGGIYAPTNQGQGVAIAALVCGILSLLCGISAIAGVICGIIGISQAKKSGNSSAKVMSIVGLVISALVIVGMAALFIGLAASGS